MDEAHERDCCAVRISQAPRSRKTLTVFLLALLAAGCAHHRYHVARPVQRALEGHAVGLPVEQCVARVHKDVWEVDLDVHRGDADYHSDFYLEQEQAEQVVQAIARSEVVFDQRWDIMRLSIHTRFGKFRWHNRYSFFKVALSRADMDRARAGGLSQGSAKQVWQRATVAKQDGRNEELDWPADSAEPMRRVKKE